MSARTYAYRVVDVFTEVPFAGNPLAVFGDAEGLRDDEMQMLARELRLSETTFVFPPRDGATAARVRIFTSGAELAFAGHPTLGTAFALVAAGRVPSDATSLVLDENIGHVRVRVDRRSPFFGWLQTPSIAFGATHDRDACARALGLDAGDFLNDLPVQVVSAGNPFLYAALVSREAVDRAVIDARALHAISPELGNGVFFFAPVHGGVYARMVAAEATGVGEDPATGSATGPLGAYLARYGLIEARDGASFVNEQGVKMKRRSLLHGVLRYRDGELETVEVGGGVVPVIEATVTL